MAKIKLNKISSQSFEHEADRKALEALRKTVGFDRLIKALASITTDKLFGVISKSNYLKLGPKQVPSLYKLYLEVCDTLDMEPPPFYLTNSAHMNAFTAGAQEPILVVTSALVDGMTDKEIQAVLGHELGHWMAGHVLYRMVAEHIKEILVLVGDMAYGLGPLLRLGIVPTLMYWYRCAELTADRAGLLAVQDLDTVLSVEMKLASGAAGRFSKELQISAFMEQAKEVAVDEDTWSNIYRSLIEMNLTHPWPVVRAREIEKWVKSGEYGRILEGDYVRRAKATVADGPHPNKEADGGIAAAAAEIAIGAALARAYGVHVAPRIPEHALHLALGAYVESLGPDERVMALYDDTFSGTGDRGVVLTSERVFASGSPKKGVRYSEVQKVEELPSGLLSRPGLQVDGLELRFHTRDVRDAFKGAILGAMEVHRPR
ncbi:MAG: M48 family metallopeptidase [Planctomycetota bacterium]